MANAVPEPVAERTFQYQSSLPPLPVPSLESSLNKYLEAVRPFASENEFSATAEIVRKFQAGVGRELHQTLLQRAKTRRNWLEDWWLDSAYLEARIPAQLNVNFAGPSAYLEHWWPPAEGVELQRNSIATWHTLQFWDMLRKEKVPPQKAGRVPLDMDQFRMLFCTCKVPGVTKDSIHNYFKTGGTPQDLLQAFRVSIFLHQHLLNLMESSFSSSPSCPSEREGPCPSHLVVMCRGRIFTFDAVCDGRILSPPELLRQLRYVRELCDGEPEGEGVSALTTEERTRWANTRQHLIGIDPHNQAVLETVQSSLFIVVLDDSKPHATPENYSNVMSAALTGDPTTRWGDKSYNFISFANGTFGILCDHAPYDGMTPVSMSWILDQKIKAAEGKWQGPDTVRPMRLPEELKFTLDDRVRSDISQAKKQYLESIQDLQILCYAFTAFGKAAIKKRKLHPDTFVQMAMQLAYYRLYKRPGSCYETAMTRKFYHGRTETMRSSTQEALDWCKTMLDPKCDDNTKRKAMLRAFDRHNKLMAEAQEGNGFDRHLLGLYLIAKEAGLPVPELYTDPLYTRSGGGGNFVLSSSLTGYTTLMGAVAPMVHNGYGFFYRIRDDRIVAAVSAWKSCLDTDANTMFNTFSSSMYQMMLLATASQL